MLDDKKDCLKNYLETYSGVVFVRKVDYKSCSQIIKDFKRDLRDEFRGTITTLISLHGHIDAK